MSVNGAAEVKLSEQGLQIEAKAQADKDAVEKVELLADKNGSVTDNNDLNNTKSGGEEVEKTENVDGDASEKQQVLPTMSEIGTAIDELDEDIENAFGRAADSIWSIASSVGSVVRQRQHGLDSLRKNVSSHLAPLDSFGRDLGSQIGALAPKEETLASFTGSITGSITSVAETVQRKASAMEAAILSKANSMGTDGEPKNDGVQRIESQQDSPVPKSESILPFVSDGVDGLAKVSKTLSDSIVGQTVGGIWDGLWGADDEEDDEEWEDDPPADGVPRTRFEERLFEIQANPDTYCKPATDLAAFEKWGEGFDLDQVANQCISILHKHGAIANLYIKVVPSMVEEDTFWMRYFFAKHVLEKEEERRRKLLKQAETAVESGGAEDDGWGDDDWGDDNEDGKLKKSNSSKDAGPSIKGQNKNMPEPEKMESSSAGGVKVQGADVVSAKVSQSKASSSTAVADGETDTSAGAAAALGKSSSKDVGDGWSDDDWE